MNGSIQSVTTMGYGISGGYAGTINLVTTLGYGIDDLPPTPGGNAQTGGLLLLDVGGVGVAGSASPP